MWISETMWPIVSAQVKVNEPDLRDALRWVLREKTSLNHETSTKPGNLTWHPTALKH